MVYINSLGTTELFTGAYNKRVEQNKSKVAAGVPNSQTWQSQSGNIRALR